MIKFVGEVTYRRCILGYDHNPVHHLSMPRKGANVWIRSLLLRDKKSYRARLFGINHPGMGNQAGMLIRNPILQNSVHAKGNYSIGNFLPFVVLVPLGRFA